MARESPRILVVDDDDSVISVMQQYFATAGYRVEFAQHGGDALTLVQHAADLPPGDHSPQRTSALWICKQPVREASHRPLSSERPAIERPALGAKTFPPVLTPGRSSRLLASAPGYGPET